MSIHEFMSRWVLEVKFGQFARAYNFVQEVICDNVVVKQLANEEQFLH